MPDHAAGLTLDKLPGEKLRLSWDSSCSGGDSDYQVCEGLLGDFTSHIARTCTTAACLPQRLGACAP